MSYVVLARKYRPKQFPELVGQQHIATTLLNAFQQNKLGQAYLFTGTRGVGKTSAARIFAKALRCEHPDHKEGNKKHGLSCDTCPSCLEINLGNSIDVLEIDGASNNGVDNVREIREAVKFLPSRGSKKIYIIDEVHMLTGAAFNALLKTLEEPPAHVVFLLATTEVHKIPATILSRCQRFDFKRVSQPLISEYLLSILQKEGIKSSNEAVRMIARKGDGSMRDSLSTLDQVLALSNRELTVEKTAEALGAVSQAFLVKLLGSSLSKKNHEIATLVAQAFESGIDLKQLALDLCETMRNALFIKMGAEKALDLSKEEQEELAKVTRETSEESLQAGFKVLAQAVEELLRSPMPRLSLEMALLRVAAVGDLLSLKDLLKQQTGASPSATTTQTIDRSSEKFVEKKNSEPVATAPSNPPEPTKEAKIEDKLVPNLSASWRGFLEQMLQESPSMGALLEHAIPIKEENWADLHANTIILAFKKSDNFYLSQLQSKNKAELLTVAIQKYLGRNIRLQLELAPDTIAASSLRESEKQSQSKTLEEKKKEFLAKDIVRDTKEIFGAELSSFDINKNTNSL